MRKTLLWIWVLLRLPIILAGLYLFRTELAVWVETHFNLALVIESIVYLISTAWLRFLLLGFMSAVLAGIYLILKKWLNNAVKEYYIFILIAFVLFIIFLTILLKVDVSYLPLSIVILILALNTIPENWLDKYLNKNIWLRIFFILGIGISETVFLQSYFQWIAKSLNVKGVLKKWSWILGILLACFYFFFLLTPYNNQRILTLGEKIHNNPAVKSFSTGGYNWIELNSDNTVLYASGHNVNYIMAYDLKNLSLPPRKSGVQVGKPQSFAYNPDLQEIYVYKRESQELLYLDAVTLDIIRAVPAPNLALGDVWVNWQRGTDTITIASEADYEVGVYFIMLKRENGEILEATDFPIAPTNVAFDVENNIFYFSSFRENYIFSWDMLNQEILNHVKTSKNTDRLIYNPISSEILVASPQEGAILRYDATTLKFLGKINVSIGDRTLALDEKRNLLLVGNFINNYLQVIDLNTEKTVERYYIGPWIRTIAVDEENGVAYISTIHNLFKVNYAK